MENQTLQLLIVASWCVVQCFIHPNQQLPLCCSCWFGQFLSLWFQIHMYIEVYSHTKAIIMSNQSNSMLSPLWWQCVLLHLLPQWWEASLLGSTLETKMKGQRHMVRHAVSSSSHVIERQHFFVSFIICCGGTKITLYLSKHRIFCLIARCLQSFFLLFVCVCITWYLHAGVNSSSGLDGGWGVSPVYLVWLCVLSFTVDHCYSETQPLCKWLSPAHRKMQTRRLFIRTYNAPLSEAFSC